MQDELNHKKINVKYESFVNKKFIILILILNIRCIEDIIKEYDKIL